MAVVDVSITGFEKLGNGQVRIEMSHSVEGTNYGFHFSGFEDVTRFCDLFLHPDLATSLAFVLTAWKARDPGLDNPGMLLGKTLRIDFTSPTPIRVL